MVMGLSGVLTHYHREVHPLSKENAAPETGAVHNKVHSFCDYTVLVFLHVLATATTGPHQPNQRRTEEHERARLGNRDLREGFLYHADKRHHPALYFAGQSAASLVPTA